LGQGSPRRIDTASVVTESIPGALNLLAEERKATQEHRVTNLMLELVEDLLIGVFLFALPLGVLTIFWSRAWGLWLLCAALLAFVLLGLLPRSELLAETNRLRRLVDDADLSRITDAVRQRQRSVRARNVGLITAAACATGAAGAGVLLISLISDNEVSIAAMSLLIFSSLLFWLTVGIDTYRDYHYYSAVIEAQEQLESRLSSARSTDQETIIVSRDELRILSRAEANQTARLVREALDEAPSADEASWSIVLTPRAKASLDDLATKNPAQWRKVMETIQSLQHNPCGDDAPGAPAEEGWSHVSTSTHKLSYGLDDGSRSVRVHQIEEHRQGRGDA
jgi:hypothetical protein